MAPGTVMGRRIKAARHFAGLRNIRDLSKAINLDGFSVGTLRDMEQGRKDPNRQELRVIADACNVPLWFLEEGVVRPEVEVLRRIRVVEQKLDKVLAQRVA
jgi:transcriptional regulator with XRE-family HTH domain